MGDAGNELVIGVLALQGAFLEHVRMLRALGVQAVEVRTGADMQQQLDGLVIPGAQGRALVFCVTNINIGSLCKSFVCWLNG